MNRAAAWARLGALAHGEAQRLDAALADPAAAQRDLLAKLLRCGQASAFGKAHGLDRIDGPADFAAAVPIGDYESHRPYIDRIAEGASSELTGDRVVVFEETGGTSAGGKLVPYTQGSLDAFRNAVLAWMHALARRHRAVAEGSFYFTISPAARPARTTPGGIPIGIADDSGYLGADVIPLFGALMAVPDGLGEITSIDLWQVATLAALIEAEDLAFLSLWSPTFMVALLGSLPGHADAVRARLSPSRRRALDAALGERIDSAALWPRLACIATWTDGPSAGFARQLQALFPQAIVEGRGLLATEGAVSLAYGADGACVPALCSTYLEFMGGDGDPRLAHELIEGESYRVLMTTPGGLWRYDIGDIVTCAAMRGGVPDLRFVGRGRITSDMVGEKLEDGFVARILGELPFAAQLVARADPPHYALVADYAADASHWLDHVETGLRANPQYAYARRLGQLGEVRLEVCKDRAAQLTREGVAAGKLMGDLKPTALVPLARAVAAADPTAGAEPAASLA